MVAPYNPPSINPKTNHAVNRRIYSIIIYLTSLFLFTSNSSAQNNLAHLQLDTISHAQNINVPWDIEWGGNNDIFFTEIDGQISRLDLETKVVTVLYQYEDIARELQAGVMGMALHPNFPETPLLYVASTYYASSNNNLWLRLSQFRYHVTNPALELEQNLLDSIPSGPSSTGCRVLTTAEGYLFVSIGDLDQGEIAQDWNSVNGKILRLHLDGSIPTDNPMPNSPIWSIGHRNPQGLIEGKNNLLYSSEHGTFSNDEVNLITKAGNYGWPIVAGLCDFNTQQTCAELGISSPIQAWSPTVAPCGIAYYSTHNNEDFSVWENSLLVGNLKDQSLICLKLHNDGTQVIEQHTYLSGIAGRIRDVLVNPDGRVFICTSNEDRFGTPRPMGDQIIELIPGEGNGMMEEEEETPVEFNIMLDSTLLEVRILTKELKIPWDLVWGPDDWIWFSERSGNIKRTHPETGETELIYTIEEVYESTDNSGLHAFALHPDFPEEPYMYVNYTYNLHNARFVRFTYDPTQRTFIDSMHILTRIRANETHNGSRLLMLPDQTMLLSIGDAYDSQASQRFNSYNGKMLRFNLDGSIPNDNPMPNNLTWSYGHRNPQGLTFGRDGRIYSSEHGTFNDDELNQIHKGRNYGWPEIQGYCDLPSEMAYCDSLNVVEPLMAWTPTGAPCGLAFYDHPAIPEWRNSLLQTFLKAGDGVERGQRLKQLQLNEEGSEIIAANDFFVSTYGRIRDVLVAPDGRIFLCTSNRERNGSEIVQADDDKIIVIESKGQIRDSIAAQSFQVFPNPSQHDVIVALPILPQQVQFVIYSITGQQLWKQQLNTPQFNYTIPRNGLPAGQYFLSVKVGNEKPMIRQITFL